MESGPAKLAKSAGEPEHEQFRRIEIADRYNNGREPLRCVHLLFFMRTGAEENIKRPETLINKGFPAFLEVKHRGFEPRTT